MATKNKYYVVWNGMSPGIYNSWEECKECIMGVSNVRYKGFKTLEEAEKAFDESSDNYWGNKSNASKGVNYDNISEIIQNSIAVDAACSGNPGVMEYQGVYTFSGTQVFLKKFKLGTNNIGEFLAIVHCLAFQKMHKMNLPIYSDSKIAITWVKAKKCRSKLPLNYETKELFEIINRAEQWLKDNSYRQPILKWETKLWGEIPADFGRK